MHMPDLPGSLDPEQPLALAVAFARISQDLLRGCSDEGELYEQICRQSRRVIDADFCGITIRRRRGRLESPAVSDQLAARCDQLQYELGEGPCVASTLEDQGHLVHDTRTDERWRDWCSRVAELGVRSILSVRLPGDGQEERHRPLGAVNLYAFQPGAFGELHLLLAEVYAAHAATAIAHLRTVHGLEQKAESRHAIGVAQGVLAQRYGLRVEQAFEVLQRCSSESNQKLRDVAEQVVREGSLPGLAGADGAASLVGEQRAAPT